MINIRIEETGAYAEVSENGILKWRELTTDALIRCLCSAIGKKTEEINVPSPLLPMGAIGYTAYPHETDMYDLFMFQPITRTTLLYQNRSFDDVGIPAAVYKFEVRNKHVKTSMWAVEANVPLRPDTPLCHYPVYNVSSETGYLCVGNVITVNEPWELFKVPGMIQCMPSTNAYVSRNNSGLERDSLYKALQGRDFPDEWLTPADITLGKVLRR